MDKDIPQLTAGVCDQIASSTGPQDLAQFTSPIVQILQPKVIELNGKKRWRILISDGTHALPVMVATQLNALFEDGHAGDGSIVRVQRLTANAITGRRQVILQSNIIPAVRMLNATFWNEQHRDYPRSRSLGQRSRKDRKPYSAHYNDHGRGHTPAYCRVLQPARDLR